MTDNDTTAIDEVAVLLTSKGIDPALVARFHADALAGEAGSWWVARTVSTRPDGQFAATYHAGQHPEPQPARGLGGLVTDGASLIRKTQERIEVFERYGRENAEAAAPNLAEDLL